MFNSINSQVFKNIRVFFKIVVLTLCIFVIMSFGLEREIILEKHIENEATYVIEIPSILLKESLCNTSRDVCLETGLWLKAFDLQKKNFLLTGHSFFIYPLKAGVLYRLEEINLGDHIYLSFGEDMYVYEVVASSVHDRYDLEIENFEYAINTLRIYTCYPSWNNLKRLVVEALLL
jgi:LPXTG-site transpeptidase (sortase) family protein